MSTADDSTSEDGVARFSDGKELPSCGNFWPSSTGETPIETGTAVRISGITLESISFAMILFSAFTDNLTGIGAGQVAVCYCLSQQ
ncbi:hypothetical protein [Thiolapillus sp.]